MTMDEKIAFWRQVMQYARDRGVDVYVFTWNIFVKGTENSGYGLTTDPANVTTKDWVRGQRGLSSTLTLCWRASASPPARTWAADDPEKEQWCWDTFG